ncbi:MAG: PIG-L family deacetylase, partial [Pseudomonadota bacterium]
MIEENQLIPFTTSTLPGHNWLVFAPHADDETIGMGGTISNATAREVNVNLVVMTNGALGKEDQQTRAEIINIREQEVKTAVAILGIKTVTFLNEEDRGLSVNQASINLLCQQITKNHPDVVFIPSALELHPDHRVTSELVWQSLRQVNYTGQVFSYDISVQSPISHLVDISKNIEKKITAIRAYSSQTKQNNYIDTALALNKTRTYTLPDHVQYAEGFKQLFVQSESCFSTTTFKSLQPFWQAQPIEKDNSVAIIIVSFNAGAFIARCLDAILAQTHRPEKVIVADNNSSDNTLEQIKDAYPWVEILAFKDNFGFAKANNIAVQHCQDITWVALLNPDAFAEPQWLEQLLKASKKHPQASFFGSRLVNAENPQQLDGEGDIYHVSGAAWRNFHGVLEQDITIENTEIFSPCAAAALYQRKDFLSVDGFDEQFFCYLEDI